VTRGVAGVSPLHALSNFRSLDQTVALALRRKGGALNLVAVFSGVALVLAALGVYGVISYTIAQTERECAIRIALGAERWVILRDVIRRGLRLVAGGITLGLVVALIGSQLLAAQLYGIDARDPLVFVLAPVLVAVVALIAAALPSRRATRADVLQVLRSM
jgi:ABC-type antimicrobial peptide transport system permease subunit